MDIIDLNIAKRLKRNGFNVPTKYFYLDKKLSFVEPGLKWVKEGERNMNHNRYDDFIYSAPTKEVAIYFLNKLIKTNSEHDINLLNSFINCANYRDKHVKAHQLLIKLKDILSDKEYTDLFISLNHFSIGEGRDELNLCFKSILNERININ